MASPTTERILRGHAPKGIYRAERLRRRGSKCLFSAPQPLCVRYFPVLAANGSPPLSRRISPPQRQRRCAIQPGVVRVAALPRVQAAARSLPRKGLCRPCPSEGAISKGGMGWGSLVGMKGPPGRICQDTHNPPKPHATRSILRHNPFRVVDMLGMDPG